MKLIRSGSPTRFLRGSLLLVVSLLALFALPALVAAQTQTYKITDLGTLGGSESLAFGINASSQITGGSTTANDAAYHAFLYSNGTMTDLGTLGGPSSQGQSINNSGVIAGYAQLPPSPPPPGSYHKGPVNLYSAFVTDNGKMTALGQPGGAGYAINNAGQVAAEASNGAFVFTNGVGVNIGSLGGTSGPTQVNAINSLGEVVGYSYLPSGDFRGFYWINGKMTAIGTLGGDWSQAYGINDSAQITGTAYTKGNLGNHAFLFQNGTMKDLGTLGGTSSVGTAINTSGVVVGYAQVRSSSEFVVYHAFVYNGTKMMDLNTLIPARSGWVLEQANAVNDSGAIVGYGTIKGNEHAFLLTPQ